MKKTLIAIASVAALGAAQADVTLYGLIDASAVSVSSAGNSDGNNPANVNVLNSYASPGAGYNNSANTLFNSSTGLANGTLGSTASGRTTTMASGLLSGSRWGIKGSEDLGSGMKANFTLESALNIAAGSNPNDHLLLANSYSGQTGAGDSSLNGQMFDRQSTVGLSGDFGSIDVGFQSNANIDANATIDPFALGAISPVGFYSSWNGGGSSYTNRASNSIKYKTTMGNTFVEAFYAMGGVSGNAGAGSQAGLMAKIQATPALSLTVAGARMNDDVSYDNAPVTIYANAANTVANKDTGLTLPSTTGILGYAPALQATYYNSTTAILGGSYQASSNLILKGGYITITQTNPSNGSADAQIFQNNGIPINPNAIYTQKYATNYSRNIAFVGGTYDLTPTNHLTAAYYKGTLGSYTANVYGGNGGSSPVQQTYSSNTYNVYALAFVMDLSKRTNVYVAAAYQNIDNPGVAPGAAITGAGANTSTSPMNQTTSAGTSQSLIATGLRVSF
jgi:predicted porin